MLHTLRGARKRPRCSTGSAIWHGLRVIALGLALLLSAGPAIAAGHGIDAVLVIDSSGSMKFTDPMKLRVPAAKLFVSLLGAHDRVGVISFSDLGYPLIGLTAPSPARQRHLLFRAIDKVSSNGAHTNIYDALRSAQRMLVQEGNPGRRRYIILMSDGKMDTGHKALDAALTLRIRNQLLPQLRKQGIRVDTIAFTLNSDTKLLGRIARSTSGQFRLARTDADLHRVFTDLFESTKHPDMLVVKGGRFLVDSAVREVTIVASKSGAGVKIVLQSPRGVRYSAHRSPPSMRWFVSTLFDMITVAHPDAGRWAVLASSGGDKAYVLTDLKLKTDSAAHDVLQGAEPVLRAWLTRAGHIITQPQVLASTRIQAVVRQPDGVSARYRLLPPLSAGGGNNGIYSGQVSLWKAGLNKITLIATGKTFEREAVRYVYVNPAAVSLPPASPVAATVAVVPPTLTPPAVKPATSPPRVAAPRVPVAPRPAAPVRRPLSLWIVLSIFVLLNLVLGGVVLLVVALRQPRAAAAGSDDGQDADREEQ